MNIEIFSYSGKGGRPVNEDSLLYGKDYYIVSDGLGGHDNGKTASAAAVRFISENYRSDISEGAVAALLSGADSAVRKNGQGGKATLAALLTDGDKIRIANVGDSRVYYFRNGRMFFRSKDHSVCQTSIDIGEITGNDLRNSEDRSGLFKVLGDTDPLKLPEPYDVIDPHNGDAFLICSDGFWEYVCDMEMEADLLKSANANEWLTHMLKRLLLRSENNGDNFTAICGIIHTTDKMTAPAPATYQPDRQIQITSQMDTQPRPKVSRRTIIILACAGLISAAAITAAIMLCTANNGNGGSSGEADLQSVFSTSEQGETDQTEGSGQNEGTDRSPIRTDNRLNDG